MNYITVTVKTLLDSAMNAASLASSYKGRIDSLSFVRLLVTKNGQQAFFSASNSAQTHTVGFQVDETNLDDETEVLISGAKMRQILSGYKSLKPDSKATIEWADFGTGKCTFKAGRSKLKTDTLDPESFPSPMKINAEDCGQAFLNYGALDNAVKSTRHAIPSNDSRYFLNGLNLSIAEGKLLFTGSDGHRLYRGSLEEVKANKSMSGIVPTPMLDMLIGVKAEADTPCRVRMDTNGIEIVIGNNLFRSSLIDGQYPNVETFFENEPTWLAEITPDEILNALNRLQATTDSKIPAVSLNFSGEEIGLSTVSKKEVTGEDAVGGKLLSKLADTVSFNIRYLIDAISANSFQSEKVSLGYNESGNFLVVKGNETASESIIMQMKL